MSNHAKLLISVLFIAVILLCIGLTRFYFDVTKNTDNSGSANEVKNIVRQYGNLQVFESSSGYYGVLDQEGAVLIEPEWMEILDMTSSTVLVSRRMYDIVLIGGIDYEENVVLPFVFRSMEHLNDKYTLGIVEDDGSYLVYTQDYVPVFFRSFENADYTDGILSLETEECIFSYDITSSVPNIRSAELSCTFGGIPWQWRVANQVYLADLQEADLLQMNRIVSRYMDMLIESTFDELPEISGSDYLSKLTKPGSFTDFTFESVSNFSLSAQDVSESAYDFAFTISGQSQSRNDRTVQVHLYFHRNADNQMILTSSDLDFQREDPVFPDFEDWEDSDEDAE